MKLSMKMADTYTGTVLLKLADGYRSKGDCKMEVTGELAITVKIAMTIKVETIIKGQ